MKCSYARYVWLQFTGCVRGESRHRYSVGGCPCGQGIQTRDLVVSGRHDQLSATVVGDTVFDAEVDHAADPPDGQVRFTGARRVVDPGVEDSTVVARLVRGHPGFLLKNRDADTWQAQLQCVGGRQANDSTTHDNHVAWGISHVLTLPVVDPPVAPGAASGG